MKIEVLFPELCNLNGDLANIKYLQKCIPSSQIIETNIQAKPAFINSKVALIYMGALSEKSQELVIQKLKPYQKKIKELIQKGQVFLFTGNSLEILGKYILNEDGSKIKGLNIFNMIAKRNRLCRHNSIFLGEYKDIEIVGFKSQFSMLYKEDEKDYFIKVKKGIGINLESKLEGILKNNLFATSLIGPFLILNPSFTLELLEIMGVKEPHLAFEKEMFRAYQERLIKFKSV